MERIYWLNIHPYESPFEIRVGVGVGVGLGVRVYFKSASLKLIESYYIVYYNEVILTLSLMLAYISSYKISIPFFELFLNKEYTSTAKA